MQWLSSRHKVRQLVSQLVLTLDQPVSKLVMPSYPAATQHNKVSLLWPGLATSTSSGLAWQQAHHLAWPGNKHIIWPGLATNTSSGLAWQQAHHLAWPGNKHIIWPGNKHIIWPGLATSTSSGLAWQQTHHLAWPGNRHISRHVCFL